MTKRHATIIIGLLVAALIGVALVAGPRQSTGQAELAPVVATPPMPDVSPEDEAKLKAELRQRTEEMLANLPPAVVVSGEQTAGKPIVVAGKEIQLPADVYVAHYIISSLCGGGASGKCPQPPMYVLAYRGTEKTIAINTETGIVQDNPDKPADANLQARSDFAWLVQAIGKEVTK